MLLAAALVLAGGTIVGPKSDIRNAVVIIRDGKIVAAGPQRRVAVPADARVIDVSGAYIVPGLNDAFAGMNSQSQANAYLYMGVTSIVGSDLPGGRRGALLKTARPSPRIHPFYVIVKPEEVDEAARRGDEVVVLDFSLTPEQTRARLSSERAS